MLEPASTTLWPHLLALALVSVATICIVLIAGHGQWDVCSIGSLRGHSVGRFRAPSAESWAREVESPKRSDVVRSWLVCHCSGKLVEL
jgi:hypothetical protein